jgi:hypothetical protein
MGYPSWTSEIVRWWEKSIKGRIFEGKSRSWMEVSPGRANTVEMTPERRE